MVIVYCDDSLLETHINSYDFDGLNVKFEVWKDEPNFANQVNRGVEISTSNWVSLIEFDDDTQNETWNGCRQELLVCQGTLTLLLKGDSTADLLTDKGSGASRQPWNFFFIFKTT